MPSSLARRRSSRVREAATQFSGDEAPGAIARNSDAKTKAAQTNNAYNKPQENIFLFWPNIIGYIRIILAFASLYYMPLHPRTCSLLYSISCLLDALDGPVARMFQQSTRFGAVLDMVTDRCTTSCLLVFLSSAFPRWAIVFQGLMALDFSSHYIHMYATLVVGGTESSHKSIDKSKSWLLNLYYTNRTVLFLFCAFNEGFFIALYLLSFSSPLLSPHLIKSIEATSKDYKLGQPINKSLLEQIFPDPFSASALELARAHKLDSTIPWILIVTSAPIMLAKQLINVVQLVKASRWLAEVDMKTRREQGPSHKPKRA